MARVREILEKILFPKWWITFLSVPIATVGLLYAFAGNRQEDWLTYLAYGFSACSLTWGCALVIRYAGRWRQEIHAFVERTPLVKRYLTDKSFSMHVSLYCSLGINVFYAVSKLGFGIFYRSAWCITLAIYYCFLAVMRFCLLRYARENIFGEKPALEWKRYWLCGWLLLVMNGALAGMAELVVVKNEGFSYAGYLIYMMALYAFYNVAMAARNVIKYRRYHSPVMSAVKAVQLAAALVSILALETAMLSQFGGDNTEAFRKIMTGCTGAGVCGIILGIAVYMIAQGTKSLRSLEKEDAQ